MCTSRQKVGKSFAWRAAGGGTGTQDNEELFIFQGLNYFFRNKNYGRFIQNGDFNLPRRGLILPSAKQKGIFKSLFKELFFFNFLSGDKYNSFSLQATWPIFIKHKIELLSRRQQQIPPQYTRLKEQRTWKNVRDITFNLMEKQAFSFPAERRKG